MIFSDFALSSSIQANIVAQGYETPTPIQEQAIPLVLSGADVLGSAQTGSGKTAAFALPILQLLTANPAPADTVRPVRALILCPTRELAAQIGDSFRAYGKNLGIRFSVVFGGVNIKPQAASLRNGVDIVIATPGRLMDLHNQRMIKLDKVQMLVLDEADRMLDMGFIHDIRKIIAFIPKKRQTLFFSATMPREIRQLSETILTKPTHIQIAPDHTIAANIEESVYFVPKAHKPSFLAHLFHSLPMSRAIVFTRTKHGADRVVRCLAKYHIQAEALHANKSQNARIRALDNFKSMKTPMLVATDIASRGIDVDDISHVVNYDVTHEPETYVHRIGRTARAGASGCAICLCDTSDELDNLKGIERLIKHRIPVKEAEGFVKPRTAPNTSTPRERHNTPSGPYQNRERRPDHFPVAERESHFQDPYLDSINPPHQPRKKFDPENRPHRSKPYNTKPHHDEEFGAVLNELSQLEDPSQHPLFNTEQEFPTQPPAPGTQTPTPEQTAFQPR